ncbi:MAG: HigA family addiction module antitoxin [Chloroflexi bacterium]|nr:HigA family addiction module antitoxin [Chloroflexota bacterium]
MESDQNLWQPDWTVAPGEVLLEALEERSMTQAELSRRMNRPLKTVNEIVKAKAAITPETAIQLERTLGISAHFWNGLELNYRSQFARRKAVDELRAHLSWADRFPIKDLAKRGLIRAQTTKSQTVEDLLKFFAVSSPRGWEQQWEHSLARYRSSPSFETSREPLSAWLRWGEIEADKIECEPFERQRWLKTVANARKLTTKQPISLAIGELQKMCAQAGVALVLIPEFSGTFLSGAARWLTREKAIIQLSLRHKSDDQLWFTFFHESGHLIESQGRDFIDLPLNSVDRHGHGLAEEAERTADEFARRALIPEEEFHSFLERGDFSKGSVIAFARLIDIAPGLVVGRLQRDGHIPRSRLNSLKRRVQLI